MTRPASPVARARRRGPRSRSASSPAAPSGPNYSRPADAGAAAAPLPGGPGAGGVAGRRAVVGGHQGPAAAGPRSARASRRTSTCASPPPASRRRARRPESRSRSCSPRSTSTGGYGAQQVSRLSEPPQGTRPRRRTRTGTPASRSRGRSTSSAASGARRRPRSPRSWRPSRAAAAALITLVADVASTYFLLRELDLQLEIANADGPAQRRDGRLLRPAAARAASRTGSSWTSAVANRALTASTIPQIERQIAPDRERAQPAARPPAGPDRARRGADRPVAAAAGAGRDCRRRCSSAGPTSSRPSSCWWPPTRTSARPRRCSSRRSR